MTALRGQAESLTGGGAVALFPEGGADGDAGGQDGGAVNAAADELLRQILVGDHAQIGGTGSHGGAARIVRRHEAELRAGAPALLEGGHHHGGDHVDADHGTVAAALERPRQTARAPGQVAVHRAVAAVALRVLLGGHIARLVQLGITAVEAGVPLGDEFGRLLGDEAQSVHYIAGTVLRLEALGQCSRHGVVAAAGITGQYQYAHGLLLSAAHAYAATPPDARGGGGYTVE